MLLGDDTWWGSQIAVCWSLDFAWTPLFLDVLLTVGILISDLHKVQIVLDPTQYNSCVSQEVYVAM
jgi:hypothetical protein